MHQVEYAEKKYFFDTEKIIAMILNHLKEIISVKNQIQIADCVISVPNYYNQIERMSLINAIKISEIPYINMINEGTAAALNYGLIRNSEFTQCPRTVVFADLGHSKFSVTIAEFVKDKVKILIHWSDRNLGGRDFD